MSCIQYTYLDTSLISTDDICGGDAAPYPLVEDSYLSGTMNNILVQRETKLNMTPEKFTNNNTCKMNRPERNVAILYEDSDEYAPFKVSEKFSDDAIQPTESIDKIVLPTMTQQIQPTLAPTLIQLIAQAMGQPIVPIDEQIIPTYQPITPLNQPITQIDEQITPTYQPITPTYQPITPTTGQSLRDQLIVSDMILSTNQLDNSLLTPFVRPNISSTSAMIAPTSASVSAEATASEYRDMSSVQNIGISTLISNEMDLPEINLPEMNLLEMDLSEMDLLEMKRVDLSKQESCIDNTKNKRTVIQVIYYILTITLIILILYILYQSQI